ncbi:TPA: Rha family transcriptional regulator [Escherichia coli]
MSALVLCGNLGVILLSVKDHQHIDSAIPGRYTVQAPYKAGAGRGKLPCYQITRDGFAFLAMGFTGKRAAQFKEAYINAFNQMEKQLSKPAVPSDVAHNASVLCSYISSIHQVWLQQLYPMLAKAESPLAVSLYDYINDASALACLINLSLNPSEVRGRK